MRILLKLLRTPEGLIGTIILLTLAAIALLAPVFYPKDPLSIVAPALLPPFTETTAPLGTDRLGRDILAGLVHGTRASLLVGIASAATAIFLGTIIGTVAGFSGGIIDNILMRITDAFQTVPSFLLALAFVSVSGASLYVIIFAIALGAWPAPARIARAEVLSLRERDYVAAARVIAMRPIEIAFREILPNAIPPVLALSAVIVAGAILTESALSFLGLGDPNIVTWGSLIAEGRSVLRSAFHISLFPGLAVVIAVLGVYLFGEGLVEALSNKKVQA